MIIHLDLLTAWHHRLSQMECWCRICRIVWNLFPKSGAGLGVAWCRLVSDVSDWSEHFPKFWCRICRVCRIIPNMFPELGAGLMSDWCRIETSGHQWIVAIFAKIHRFFVAGVGCVGLSVFPVNRYRAHARALGKSPTKRHIRHIRHQLGIAWAPCRRPTSLPHWSASAVLVLHSTNGELSSV